jgi:hypothetical protein
MKQTINDLTIEYKEGDLISTKELDKVILTKGAWCTIIFRFQNWDARKQTYGPEQYTIRRYQKKADVYKQRSKFNISSQEQALKIIDALTQWTQKSDKS